MGVVVFRGLLARSEAGRRRNGSVVAPRSSTKNQSTGSTWHSLPPFQQWRSNPCSLLRSVGSHRGMMRLIASPKVLRYESCGLYRSTSSSWLMRPARKQLAGRASVIHPSDLPNPLQLSLRRHFRNFRCMAECSPYLVVEIVRSSTVCTIPTPRAAML